VLVIGLEIDLLADVEIRLLGHPGTRGDLLGLGCDTHPAGVPTEENWPEAQMIAERDDASTITYDPPEDAPKPSWEVEAERSIRRHKDVGRLQGLRCPTR
jgi:hypothetical protein